MLYAKNSLLIMEESLPPGFRFHPTDEELITYYLSRKVSDYGFITRAIVDVDLNKCEPWDLPGKASMGEREWYFFSLRDRKYPTGLRTNRATDAGYWKTTGKDKEIFQSGVFVGMKKTLVFYMGRAPKGEKTNWVMHEYRHQTKFPYKPSKEEWVVCRIFKKSSNGKKPESMTPSMPPLLESPCNTPLSEIGEIDASMLNNIVNSSGSLYGMQTNDTSINANNNIDVNMYMNWREETTPTSLPWPSNFLVSNYSSNPDTLKTLLFNGYQPREATNITSLNSFVGQVDPIFGAESKLNVAESSSRGTDSIQQQQFDQASVWRGYEC